MTKVLSPLFSLSAHGRIDQALIFERSRNGHYVKPYNFPRKPPTAAQLAHRETFAALAAAWTAASDEHKNSWTPLATAREITNYDAYTLVNWKLIEQGLSPTTLYTPPGPPTPPEPVTTTIGYDTTAFLSDPIPGYQLLSGPFIAEHDGHATAIAWRSANDPEEPNQFAVYNDLDGSPDELLAQVEDMPTWDGQWARLAVANLEIETGTAYWIGVILDALDLFLPYYDYDTGYDSWFCEPPYVDWANPWVPGIGWTPWSGGCYSCQIEYSYTP